MSRLIGLLAVLLLALTSHRAMAGEMFSVRCEDKAPDRPYFATFDMDAKAVVFETPVLNVETNFGIGALPGEIVSTKDDEIEFIVHVPPGKLDLIFARGPKTMTWPGLLVGTFRPKLVHRCAVTPPRSILSFRSREPIQHPITVRCEHAGYAYFTMDVASKRVLFERGARGSSYRGKVTGTTQDEIKLLMNFNKPTNVVWNKSSQTVTIEGSDGDAASPSTVLRCQEVAPRTMMELYEGLKRWR